MNDPIKIAGDVTWTKEEVEEAVAHGRLNALIVAKAQNLKDSVIMCAMDQIEQRGWAVVEYAENIGQVNA